MKKLTLVRILTVFIVTSAVILSNSSTVQGTPLFFDFLKRTFGGKGKAPKPASNQRPQGSAWATGGQYQKEKKFPWDIFGIFGYKNVIRPNNRPRPQRPGPPYRPPRFLVLHVKTYHTQYDEPDLNKSQKTKPKTPTASKVIQLGSKITIV